MAYVFQTPKYYNVFQHQNIIWLSRKYNCKYVGFMAPLAKKVPDPWSNSTCYLSCCFCS